MTDEKRIECPSCDSEWAAHLAGAHDQDMLGPTRPMDSAEARALWPPDGEWSLSMDHPHFMRCLPLEDTAALTAAIHEALILIRGNCRGGHIKDSDCMGMAAELARALERAA